MHVVGRIFPLAEMTEWVEFIADYTTYTGIDNPPISLEVTRPLQINITLSRHSSYQLNEAFSLMVTINWCVNQKSARTKSLQPYSPFYPQLQAKLPETPQVFIIVYSVSYQGLEFDKRRTAATRHRDPPVRIFPGHPPGCHFLQIYLPITSNTGHPPKQRFAACHTNGRSVAPG